MEKIDYKFVEFLSKKVDVEEAIVRDYFETLETPFDVAQQLIDEEGIDRKKLGEVWGSYYNIAYVDPSASIVKEEYVDMLGSQFIRENSCLPLFKFGKAITVATSDPANPYLQDKLEKKLDAIVSFVFCFPFDIKNYMERHGIK